MGRVSSFLISLLLLCGSQCSPASAEKGKSVKDDAKESKPSEESSAKSDKRSRFGSHMGQNSQEGMAGLVSASLAEVLMIPSLTKEQQTKIRNLYLDYRPRSLQKWYSMEKLGGVGQTRGRPGKPTVGSEILAGLVSNKETAKSHMERQDDMVKMDAFDANMKRRLFGELLKDWVLFTRDVLAVLTREQRKELREIGKKTGAPDYFVKNQDDLSKFAKFGMLSPD